MRFSLIVALAAALTVPTGAYPSGAPSGSCSGMVPGHGSPPQDGLAPYTVLPARLRTEDGRVRVMLTSPQGVGFTGFMLQARGEGDQAVGHFSAMPDEAAPVACSRATRSAATHNNKELKKALEFEWEAPEDYEGPVTFTATFVQDFSTYWVGVQSPQVQVVKRSTGDLNAAPGANAGPGATPARTTRRPSPTTTTPVPFQPQPEDKAPVQSDPLYSSCGSTKSCFGLPQGCVDTQNCNAFVAVEVRGQNYEFEMKALSAVYVAVGLSDNGQMGGDSVVECVPEGGNGKVDAYMSWNVADGKNNQRLENRDAVTLLGGSYINGSIQCKFSRQEISTVEGKEFNLAASKYYLLLASGKSLRANGVGFHDGEFGATGEQLSLSDVRVVAAASKLLLRLHGAFMLAAWVGAASIGIVLARYYKQTWVGSRLCGKDQWFVWHRFFMVLVWLLTLAGFVLIFVELGAWTADSRNPHAIIGVVTTALCFVQPIGAALRPAPSSPRRPLFNWLHWLAGNLAHILAIATIFLAVPQTKAELPEWMDWVLVAYVAFYVLMHLILSVSGCVSESVSRKRVNSFPMKDMNSSRMPISSIDRSMDSPHSSLRRFMLGIHITGIVIVTAVLIVIAVLAPVEDSFKGIMKSLNIS